MLTSSMFVEGLPSSTLAFPSSLFNAGPQRSELVKHPDVPISSRTEPRQPCEHDWWLRLVRVGLTDYSASPSL